MLMIQKLILFQRQLPVNFLIGLPGNYVQVARPDARDEKGMKGDNGLKPLTH